MTWDESPKNRQPNLMPLPVTFDHLFLFHAGPSALASAVQFQPELPPPGTFSYPSTYAGSPFHAARTFPPVNSPEYIGHPQPLPPIRGFSSHRMSFSVDLGLLIGILCSSSLLLADF